MIKPGSILKVVSATVNGELMQMRWEHVCVLLWRGLSCVMSSVALEKCLL